MEHVKLGDFLLVWGTNLRTLTVSVFLCHWLLAQSLIKTQAQDVKMHSYLSANEGETDTDKSAQVLTLKNCTQRWNLAASLAVQGISLSVTSPCCCCCFVIIAERPSPDQAPMVDSGTGVVDSCATAFFFFTLILFAETGWHSSVSLLLFWPQTHGRELRSILLHKGKA